MRDRGPPVRIETVEQCNVCTSKDIDVLDAENALNVCRECGFVFDSPRPTMDEMVKYYSRPSQYDGWIDDEKIRDRLWQRRLRKVLKHTRPGSLLDVGTGVGQFLHHAQPHFAEVAGTEVSSSAVKIARERYGLELHRGTLEDLCLERKFDNVTMFHVLEHVPDPAATVAKCAEMLVSDGMLFIAVPNEIEALRPQLKRALGRLGLKRQEGQRVGGVRRITLDGSMEEIHLSHFTEASLQLLLKRQGFEVVAKGLDPYSVARGRHGWIDLGFRALGEITARVTGRNVYDAMWVVARRP